MWHPSRHPPSSLRRRLRRRPNKLSWHPPRRLRIIISYPFSWAREEKMWKLWFVIHRVITFPSIIAKPVVWQNVLTWVRQVLRDAKKRTAPKKKSNFRKYQINPGGGGGQFFLSFFLSFFPIHETTTRQKTKETKCAKREGRKKV